MKIKFSTVFELGTFGRSKFDQLSHRDGHKILAI